MRDFAAYATDPAGFARDVLGFEPTEAQRKVLDFHARIGILCCTRGFGKTQITALLALAGIAFDRDRLRRIRME